MHHGIVMQVVQVKKIRTITSSSHHRSSSASPNPLGEPPTRTSKYRKSMVSSVTDETQYQKMNGSIYDGGVSDEILTKQNLI